MNKIGNRHRLTSNFYTAVDKDIKHNKLEDIR